MNIDDQTVSARLGEITEVVMGQAPPGADCNRQGRGTPFVKAGEFEDYRPVVREWTTNPLKLARSSDVLVCVVGATAGKINESIDCAIGRSVAAVRPDPLSLSSKYLYHFLGTQVLRLRAKSQGLAQGVITREMLQEISIPLPPLVEQRRIAAILDKADELRAKRRAALAKLDSLTQSIFLDMFGDPIMNPRSWPLSALNDLGTVERGVSKHRPRNAPELLGGSYPFVQTGDVANCDGYIRSYVATYSEQGLRQSKMWPAGTLCITIAANIAKTGILTFDACFPDSIVGFRAEEPATVEFVRVWLSFLQKILERSAPESAQKNINLEILKALKVPNPGIKLQREFTRRIDTIGRCKIACRRSIKGCNALFTSLQHRAFRGVLFSEVAVNSQNSDEIQWKRS